MMGLWMRRESWYVVRHHFVEAFAVFWKRIVVSKLGLLLFVFVLVRNVACAKWTLMRPLGFAYR